MCGQCRCVRYCSLECQKASWPLHKRECAVVSKPQILKNDNLPMSRLQHFSEEYWVVAAFYEALERRRDIRSSFMMRNLQYARPRTKSRIHLTCDDVLEICHNKLNEKNCQKTVQKSLVVLLDKVEFAHSPLNLHTMVGNNALTIQASLSPSANCALPYTFKARAHTEPNEALTALTLSTIIRPHPILFPQNLSPCPSKKSLSSSSSSSSAATSSSSSSSSSSFSFPSSSSSSSSLSSANSAAASSSPSSFASSSALFSLPPSSFSFASNAKRKQPTVAFFPFSSSPVSPPEMVRDSADLVHLSFDLNFLEQIPGSQCLTIDLMPANCGSISKKRVEPAAADAPLTWDLLLAENQKFISPGAHVLQSPAGALHVRVGWRYVAKRERSSVNYFTQSRPTKGKSREGVMYHYYTSVDRQPHSETREGFVCPFCRADLQFFRALVCHLETTHDRFTLRCLTNNGIPEIHVALKPLETQAASRTWAFLGGAALREATIDTFMRLCDPVESKKRKTAEDVSSTPNVATLTDDDEDEVIDLRQRTVDEKRHSRKKRRFPHSSSSSSKTTTASSSSTAAAAAVTSTAATVTSSTAALYPTNKNPLALRQFFHTNTFIPVRGCEIDRDSDEEVEEDWKLRMQERDLDEYDDLSWSEKMFMKLWNRFAHERHIPDDRFFADRCFEFAKLHAVTLLTKNLRSAFVFHLLTMWEFGKIQTDCVIKCMSEINAHTSIAKEEMSALAELKRVQHVARQNELRWKSLVSRAKSQVALKV